MVKKEQEHDRDILRGRIQAQDICPENISEDDEGELGLGELLEEHRALYFVDKLSNNNLSEL